ncbi:hypothetical protein G4G93_02105 [Methylobacterium sp. DB0501]|nr:hypothetical protein [Methylobacterium sp. DB0501]
MLDTLEPALHERHSIQRSGLVHHADRSSQYWALRDTARLAGAGIEPSVGSVDETLAGTISGLFEAEVLHRRGPWRSFEAAESANLERVGWDNRRRLPAPIGHAPPAEADARDRARVGEQAVAA